MARYIKNPDKYGIEIYFVEKPDDAALVALKLAKWRWHPRKGCWYNQDTPENEKFAEQMCTIDSRSQAKARTVQNKAKSKPTNGQTTKKQTDTKTKVDAQAETKSNAEANSGATSEAKTRADAIAREKAESKARAEAKAKFDAEARANADAEAKEAAEARAIAEAEARAKAETKAKAEAEARARAEAKAKAEAEARIKAEAEAKIETEARKKAEAEAQAETVARARVEAELKAQADARSKAEAKAKAEAEAKAKALRTLLQTSDSSKLKESLTFAENINTLEDARELLVRLIGDKAIFGEEIYGLAMALDSYKRNSEVAAEVIVKIFPPPQMAYDKFMGDLSDSTAAFIRLICKAADIISIAVRRSAKRDEILVKIVDDARSLAELCDDLATVLINKYGDGGNEYESTKEIDILLSDLQVLIESVKNY